MLMASYSLVGVMQGDRVWGVGAGGWGEGMKDAKRGGWHQLVFLPASVLCLFQGATFKSTKLVTLTTQASCGFDWSKTAAMLVTPVFASHHTPEHCIVTCMLGAAAGCC